MRRLIEQLLLAGYEPEQIHEKEPMSKHTTMRVGGAADVLAEPDGARQLMAAMDIARAMDVPVLVIGGGSNLIVRDGGVRGLVLKLGERMARVVREGVCVVADAGARLSAVGAFAQREGLAGFEFAAGIPGTVGGGVLMNAGAYGGEIAHVLVSARVLVDGEIMTFTNEECAFGYRQSRFMRPNCVVLSAAFALKEDAPEVILSRMNELAARRRDKQPLNLPSSGSTFKRPANHFAGALIEQAGLMGYALGGAQVSDKHAGFVVNAGGATARDVIALIEHIQRTVYLRTGVSLECEVRVVGEE